MKLPSWLAPLVLCVLALRVGLMVYNVGFSSYDDGVAAEGARQILHGHIPYKDFWTMYAPGAFYINALAMLAFGERMVSVRLIGPLCGIVQAIILVMILRRVVKSTPASVACALTYLAIIPLGAQTPWFTIVLALAYSLVRFVQDPGSRWCYACGLLTGLLAMLRQDAGAYAALAVFPLMYAMAQGNARDRLAPLIKSFCAFLLVMGACVGYFAAHGALGQMLEDAVRFPLIDFPNARPLPYPVPTDEVQVITRFIAPVSIAFFYQLFGFYILPLCIVCSGAVAIRRTIRDKDQNRLVFIALAVLAAAIYLMVRVRPSGARIFAGTMVSMIAFAALASDSDKRLRTTAWLMLAASIAAFVPFGVYTTYAERTYAPNILPGRAGVRDELGHAQILTTVSLRIARLTKRNERILSGAPAVYFLADRDPATKFYEPHPCVTDTPQTQDEIIRELERNHVRYFVRSLEWGPMTYFTMEADHQPDKLIAYIEKNYRVTSDLAIFQIYERKAP